MAYAIASHNPAGCDINDGWYALAATIVYGLSADEAIYRICGQRPSSREPGKKKDKKNLKNKILKIHKIHPEYNSRAIASSAGCSEEMVRYTLKFIEKQKEESTKPKNNTITKAKQRRINRQEEVIRIITEDPMTPTMSIVKKTGLKYGTVLRYMKKYYMSLQLELPFEY